MEPHPDQIAEFSLHTGGSAQHPGPLAVLRVVYGLNYGTRMLAFPLDRVPQFADELTAAVKTVVKDNAPRPVDIEARRSPPVLDGSDGGEDEPISPEWVTGFRFEPLSDGVAIYFEHPGGSVTPVIAQWQQAEVLANYARSWYQRQNN